MKLEEHGFTQEVTRALEHVTGWGTDCLHANTQGMFAKSSKRSDLLVLLPMCPPAVVEFKFASSPGNPVNDVTKYFELQLGSNAGEHAGKAVQNGVAVLYPDGADSWNRLPKYHTDFIFDKFVAGEILKYKFIHRDASGVDSVWPSDQTGAGGGGCKEIFTILRQFLKIWGPRKAKLIM